MSRPGTLRSPLWRDRAGPSLWNGMDGFDVPYLPICYRLPLIPLSSHFSRLSSSLLLLLLPFLPLPSSLFHPAPTLLPHLPSPSLPIPSRRPAFSVPPSFLGGCRVCPNRLGLSGCPLPGRVPLRRFQVIKSSFISETVSSLRLAVRHCVTHCM